VIHESISACHRPMQISSKGVTPDGFGKNYDWDRTDHALDRPARLAFRSNRTRSLLHSWMREYHFPRRCHGDPILTTGAGKSRRIPGKHLRECQSGGHTMTPSVPATGASLGKEPRTRTNDDHSMHIPGISSHRNVNNSTMQPGSGATLQRNSAGPTLTPEYRRKQPLL
jgi:hypothetical protein